MKCRARLLKSRLELEKYSNNELCKAIKFALPKTTIAVCNSLPNICTYRCQERVFVSSSIFLYSKQYLQNKSPWGGIGLFSFVASDKMGGIDLRLDHGRFGSDTRKQFFPERGILGGVSEMQRDGVEWHGLAPALTEYGWTQWSERAFPTGMILWFYDEHFLCLPSRMLFIMSSPNTKPWLYSALASLQRLVAAAAPQVKSLHVCSTWECKILPSW